MDRRVRRRHQLLEGFRQQIRAAGRLIRHQLVQRAEGLALLEGRRLVRELRQRGGARREVEREEPVPRRTSLVVVEHDPPQAFDVRRADRLVERRVQAVARLPTELLAVISLLPALLAQTDRVLHAVVRVALLPLLQELQRETTEKGKRGNYSISILSFSSAVREVPAVSSSLFPLFPLFPLF